MLNLTLPGDMFADGRAALTHLQASRALSVTMQALHRHAAQRHTLRLYSRRWVAALHWHETGMPHYHVLIDGERVDQAGLTAIWEGAVVRTLDLPAPPFGEQIVSERYRTQSVAEAAWWLADYLTEGVVRNVPDWFLTLAVTPYTTSRPFRPPGVNAEPRARKAAAVPGPSRRRKTHAQRQVRCGAATTMIRQAVDPQTGELGRPRWERSLPLPFESARAAAGRVVDTSPDALLRDIFRLPPERVSAA
jgi:hypothetical protein